MRRVFALVLGAVCFVAFIGGFMAIAFNLTAAFLLGAERSTVIGAVCGFSACLLSVIGSTVAIRLWFKS